MSKRLARQFAHPSELTLAILRGKWTSAILSCLEDDACRYCELRRRLPGVSDKMLTKRLQELMRAGLVAHPVSSGSVEHAPYVLSPIGRSLMPLITRLSAWGLEHAARYGVRFVQPGVFSYPSRD
jgi:DNA-binding HxlR family transcriptional regulator